MLYSAHFHADSKRKTMTISPISQDTFWQRSTDIDLDSTAVLVIDILGGEGGVIPGLEKMAENAVAIVKTAREHNVPVIFVNDAHIKGLDREIELWGEHGIAGTDAARPLVDFDLQPEDFIIPKRRYDAFFQTDLDLTLQELGVDTLIAVGFDTNICVMHTLAGAYYRGYRSVVPLDACATFLVGTQEAGLEHFSRCFDSRIVETKTVLDYFKG